MGNKIKREKIKTHKEMIAGWMKDPEFKACYDALEEEYALLREMLHARTRSGLTQMDVAARMHTKAPAIARLESINGFTKHSPTLNTLRRYAEAVGCRLEVHMIPLTGT